MFEAEVKARAQVEEKTEAKAETYPSTVGIIGGGSIGVSFALVFARAAWGVRLYDPDEARRDVIRREMFERIEDLRAAGLFSGIVEEVLNRVGVVDTVALAAQDATLVMECAPERLDIKQALFAELDALAAPDAILASVSSAIPASAFARDIPGNYRCLVAHPGNPPHLIPVVELVPAPFTALEVVERAREIFKKVGQTPVVLGKEVEGFIFNRLQGALLREAYCLVRDGVASVEDIDRVVRDGLGLRWSVIGPFETVDLNTRGGIAQHALKMGPAYARMGAERGQNDPWTPELVADVERQRRAALPLEDWEERVMWRDRALMKLLHHRLLQRR